MMAMKKNTVVYKEDERFALQVDFFGTMKEHSPAVIYIHGGGLLWGTREEIQEEMVQFYLNNGFSLFSIDYRLAPETKLPDIL